MSPSHADIAVSFGRAVRDRDFDDAVALFGPEKIQLVDEIRARHNLPLGDDLEFFLRRLRCAVRALNGDIKSVSARQMNETDEMVTVLLTFECEDSRQELSVEFDRDGNAVNLSSPDRYTPPSYADASDFEEYSITLDAEGTELDAIATVPTSSESVPVAVLVPGAGEIDKNATVGPNKLFQDIAWGLATENIATLRYDKREAVTEIPEEKRTLENLYFTDGVRAAQRAAKRVDTDSVVFVGHSQGGRCAFEMARQYGDAGGVAALDPPVIKPLEGDGQQLRNLLKIDGLVPPHFEQAVKNYRTQKEQFHSQSADNQPSVFLNSMWNYDQFETAASLSTPLLLYEMELNRQAPAEKRERWREVLSNDRDTIHRGSELNHNCQRGEQPRSILEPVLFHKNVDKRVITDLADWIFAST
ncbi:dienelactone hydrolase family protein [Halovenus rubra]|uniref:Dienelactone hydrolase family protein n=2 Tax=Halovenus rubra TaxID=869890 RepID=A0ACC7E0P1_9EURY|nr:hypothetical protein [Halovenus rubra]